MAFPQKKAVILPLSQERRRFQRVRVNLLGRYMLADRREFPCQVTDMSPGGMALIAPVTGKAGERVIAYVDHVGRLEGVIARQFPNGFAMTIAATPRKRDKLAAQLTWLANRHILGLPEDRRHGRVEPRNPAARLILPNGVNVACRVIDMSLSGAAIASDQRPDDRRAGHHRQDRGPGGPPPRGRLRGRVHPAAASGLSGRERHRRRKRRGARVQRAQQRAFDTGAAALARRPPPYRRRPRTVNADAPARVDGARRVRGFPRLMPRQF